MLKKSLLYSMIAALPALFSCHDRMKGGFTVSGTYKNVSKLAAQEGPVNYAYLLEVPYGKDQQPVALDSVKISGNSGHFSLSTAARPQEIFELVFGNNALALPLVNDAEEVTVDVDLGKKDDFYELKGSQASAEIKDLINVFGKKSFDVERAMANLDSLKRQNASDSVMLAATLKKNNAIQDLNTYLRQFINTNGNATVSSLALSWASRSFTRSEFESSMKDLVKKFPGNAVLLGMKQSYDQQAAQMAEPQHRQGEGNWVGKQAPELALPDVNGNPVSLASYKGKFLLVDFWASWCGPCREENPNVVKVHDEFKGKNFAILGVSLDKEKEPWQQAIRADKLDWTHVSDLKFWNSKAVETFGFEGIPYNVLIDPQGKIIAESLRGNDLENKLKQVLN
jgi:thiol-disulfide isomerase/thioredoxin